MICPPKKYDTDRDILGSDKARLARDAIIKDRQPHKPTMEDIERLVDAMVMAFEDMHTFGGQHYMTKYKDARAALMVAIRAYGEG